MAYPGLVWQKLEIPFNAGLQQQTDDRARPQPFLDVCKDAQHDVDVGGLVTRYPYAAMSNSIFGGGTLSNCRRLAVVNNELCVFTDTALYSWNAQLASWVLRGTHLAVKVDEVTRCATPGDQVEADRAELSGTVIYAWTEGTQVYAEARDKTTGSVLVGPTAVSTAIGRPRLIALATKILLFVEASATLLTVRAIDPAAPGTAISGAGTTVLTTDFNLYYDVVRAGTQDLVVGACRRVTTTSYTAFTVTPALVVTAVTKARTADGPLAVATISDGTQTQVVRGNGTNVQGDLLTTSTLADVFTGQAIGTVTGTPINQIAAAFASTTCTAFWSSLETNGSGNSGFQTKSNTVTTANAVGTEALFIRRIGVASRAFERGGLIYVWLAFGEDDASVVAGTPLGIRAELQNTYYLYRADRLIVSKAVWQTAGGYSASVGHLPGVVAIATDVYAWVGARRRVIDLSNERAAFGARSPQEITFTFDSNEARRSARLGGTLYVSGGLVQQYDGLELSELGFCVAPWSIAVQDSGVAGNIGAGTYNWKGTISRLNAQGERERSTTATGVQLAIAASKFAIVTYFPLYVTNKTTRVPTLEFWRTVANAPPDAPYYLITGINPNTTTGDNPYIPNSTGTGATFNDNFSDTTLTAKETNPENGAFLEALAPPGAGILIATDTRIFLANVAGDPDRVWPSRQRNDGEVASFHDGLPFSIPRPGGDVTAIWFQDETLYVSRATALYVLPGDGVDNNNQGSGFGPARIVSLDVGAVSQESVALTPHGTIFLSRKGWQLLDRSGVVQRIGGPVRDYDSETVVSVDVVETQHQVRILTTARMLVWAYPRPDFPGGQWGEWTISDGVHSLMWNGTHVYLTATGPKQQQATYTALTYGQDVEETWIKLNGMMGAAVCRRIQPLGEYRSAFLLRMRIAYNYVESYVDDFAWTPSPTTVGGPLQLVHAPLRPRCEAIKVRITAVTEVVRATLATLGMSVATSGTAWTSTWSAASTLPGEMGNTVSMALSFEAGALLVDVRDKFTYTAAAGWVPSANRIGVRVRCQAGTLTVAALETAIAAGTVLATLTAADATPSKTINIATMSGTVVTASFTAGAYGSPTGEALKLTGLGMEVGVEKATLYTGLPRAQRA